VARPRAASSAAPAGWSILGLLAVAVVVVVVVLAGPADLTLPARLFVFASTLAFCVYMVRDHRHRLAKRHRLLMVRACVVVLLVLAVVLVVTAI
jgi:UDP-N-acetylmuramyl pentapeptide phosphotransferase/UDP-N-acetylglucosamine-1-phosphate transferase